MQFLRLLLATLFLAVFSTAAPIGYKGPPTHHLAKRTPPYSPSRGMETFSPPIFAVPGGGIFTGRTAPKVHEPSALPRPEHAYGSGATPSTPFRFPWTPKPLPSSPKPKLYVPGLEPVLEPVCTHAGPYCPPRSGTIVDTIKDSIAKLPGFSPKTITKGPVAVTVLPEPVVVSSGSMSAGELAASIVAQMPVECTSCGYGAEDKSGWVRFVEWVREVWHKMTGKSE